MEEHSKHRQVCERQLGWHARALGAFHLPLRMGQLAPRQAGDPARAARRSPPSHRLRPLARLRSDPSLRPLPWRPHPRPRFRWRCRPSS